MPLSQITFYKKFAKLNVQNIIVVCIGHEDYRVFLIGENKVDVSAKYPRMKLMATDLESAQVIAYGEDMEDLGLSLISEFKGLDMQFNETYSDINEFTDTVASL